MKSIFIITIHFFSIELHQLSQVKIYDSPLYLAVILTFSLVHSAQKFKSVRINYFEANHPFYKGYPLIPHLSHNDGKKLDLGFVYNEIDNNQISPNTPSVIGYGISEEPNHGEYDRPSDCGQNPKNWMYNFMRNLYPQGAKRDYQFNAIITRELINSFARNRNIQKIFLEPHLKSRLSLTSDKIKPVQCGSVRHDDHFHVQIY